MGCSKRGIVQPSCSAKNNHVDAAPEQLSKHVGCALWVTL
jgi:hypothetical protein